MINTINFSERIKKIIEYYQLSASAFADAIGVQRSSISHILSGRNKPSLEFLMKILDTYPEIDLYWLVKGKGSFPSVNKTVDAAITPEIKKDNTNANNSDPQSEIERIVIFYKDGSFKDFIK